MSNDYICTIYHTAYKFTTSYNQLIVNSDVFYLKDITAIGVTYKVDKIFYE